MNKNAARIFAVLPLIACALGLVSPPVQAQGAASGPPPSRNYIDSNGVDLVNLQFNYSTTELTIGQPGAGGMAYTRSYYSGGWTDNYTGTISGDGTNYIVSMGRGSQRFTRSGSTFAPAEGQGSTLTLDSGTQTYTFTSADGVVSTFDNTVLYVSYAQGVIRSTIYPSGERLTYNYGTATACVPPSCGVSATLHRLQSVTNSFGYQIRFNYAADGTAILYNQVTAWQTRTGVVGINMAVDYCDPAAETCGSFSVNWPSVTYAHPDSNTETVTDDAGHVTKYLYAGNTFAIRKPSSPNANSITVTNDGSADRFVTSISNGIGTWTYSHSDAGGLRTTTVADPLGHTRVVKAYLATAQVSSDQNGVGKITSFAYDNYGRMDRVYFPEGGYVQYVYDLRGNIAQTRQVSKTPHTPADIVTTTAYPVPCSVPVNCNKPFYTIDARGGQTDYTYDPVHGGMLTATFPAPSPGAVRPQVRYTYGQRSATYKISSSGATAAGPAVYVLTQVSACATSSSCADSSDEVRTTIAYDSAKNLLPTTTTTADGAGVTSASTTSSYDDIGNLKSIDGPLAAPDTTLYRYDLARQLVGIVSPDPDGSGPLQRRAAKLTYDDDGQVTVIQQGTVTDGSDSAWNLFAPLTKQITKYDDLGRAVQQSSIALPGTSVAAITQYAYDNANRLVCAVVRMNSATFGSLPDPCSISTPGQDGPDRITHFTYDAADRVIMQTAAYGTASPADTATVTYTDDGQTKTVADAAGHLSTYEYDGFDRLVKLRFPTLSGTGSSSTTDYEEYSYDAASNLTQIRYRDGQTIGFGYDALSRRSTKSSGAGNVAYGIDNLNRLASVQQNGQTLLYTHDAFGRIVGKSDPFFGAWASTWDAAGRRTRLTWPDGFYIDYDYNVLGEMIAIRENGASSGPGLLATFTYDDLGRRKRLDRGNGVSTTYGYDALSRLATLGQDLSGTVNDQSFTFTYNTASQIASQSSNNDSYDWNGSQLNASYGTPNGLNQMTAIGAGTPLYDARGNLENDTTTAYGFDAENRLTSAAGATLSYDALGRPFQVTGTATTTFVYDGANMVGELNGGTVPRRYVFGPAADEPLVWYEGSSMSRRWLLADPRGSVIAVTDDTGAAIQINRYDDFGRPASTNLGRFQYTGQAWLPEAGVYHYKARAYQPALGRFLQPDPIGYAAGMNLYGYVSGDPINATDPSGLCEGGGTDPDMPFVCVHNGGNHFGPTFAGTFASPDIPGTQGQAIALLVEMDMLKRGSPQGPANQQPQNLPEVVVCSGRGCPDRKPGRITPPRWEVGPGEAAARAGLAFYNDPDISDDTKLEFAFGALGVMTVGTGGYVWSGLSISQKSGFILFMTRLVGTEGGGAPKPPRPGVPMPPPVVQPAPVSPLPIWYPP